MCVLGERVGGLSFELPPFSVHSHCLCEARTDRYRCSRLRSELSQSCPASCAATELQQPKGRLRRRFSRLHFDRAGASIQRAGRLDAQPARSQLCGYSLGPFSPIPPVPPCLFLVALLKLLFKDFFDSTQTCWALLLRPSARVRTCETPSPRGQM